MERTVTIETELLDRQIQYFIEHGKQYTPAICPRTIHRGRPGDCFDTSIKNAAMVDRSLRYVEGIALNTKSKCWIYHAWVSDGEHAYDPTWRTYKGLEEIPMIAIYIGIEMNTDAVMEFMLETEYKALFDNGWRNPELFRKALPKALPDFIFNNEQARH